MSERRTFGRFESRHLGRRRVLTVVEPFRCQVHSTAPSIVAQRDCPVSRPRSRYLARAVGNVQRLDCRATLAGEGKPRRLSEGQEGGVWRLQGVALEAGINCRVTGPEPQPGIDVLEVDEMKICCRDNSWAEVTKDV